MKILIWYGTKWFYRSPNDSSPISSSCERSDSNAAYPHGLGSKQILCCRCVLLCVNNRSCYMKETYIFSSQKSLIMVQADHFDYFPCDSPAIRSRSFRLMRISL